MMCHECCSDCPSTVSSSMRERVCRVLMWIALCVVQSSAALAAVAVIPNPSVVVTQQGVFSLQSSTPIIVAAQDQAARRVALYLADLLERSYGLRLPVRSGAPRDGAINLRRESNVAKPDAGLKSDLPSTGKQAYALDVTPHRITIAAADNAGL